MAKTVPGCTGWGVTGDKSLEFAKSPLDFIEKRVNQHNSKIFQTRVLNKPTMFVTSSKGVKEVLVDKEDSFKMGYKDFGYIYNVYGDLLLFYDGSDAMRVRGVIGKLFSSQNCLCYLQHVDRVADEFLSKLHDPTTVPLYETFKEFATALSLFLFLDVDWRQAGTEFHTIKSISILHWHGLQSVPVSVKVKGWSTAYTKSLEAREYLLKAIRRKISSQNNGHSFVSAAGEAGFKDEEEAVQHLLLFVSALIPKALSSLLASFCLAMAGSDKTFLRARAREDDTFLENVILEVQRLWPPFLGGRRITKEIVEVMHESRILHLLIVKRTE